MAANSPGVDKFTMRIGVDELLYSNLTATGIPQTSGKVTVINACFAVPPQMSNYRGRLVLMAVPIGGTVTAATISFLASLDGGTTFGVYNNWSGTALQPYSGIAIITPVSMDISGMGGNGRMSINLTTLTLGTGTGINIYGRIG